MAETQSHPQTLEFTELFLRARSGNRVALQDLFERYVPALLKVIRPRMTGKLRHVFDSTDFLAESMLAILQYPLRDKDFATPAAFVSFLRTIAINKVNRAKRKHLASPGADLGREQSFDTLTAEEAQLLVDSEPQPLEIAIAKELWEELLKDQPPLSRTIARMLRAGWKQAQIAVRLRIHESFVRRIVKGFRKDLLPGGFESEE